MTLPPGYGETPVPDDDLELLLPPIRNVLDEPISKAAVYDLEQAIQAEVYETLIEDVLDGGRTLDDLLSDQFLRDLHTSLYGDIWIWAGVYRRHELNIGVDPWQITVQLRSSLENILYRWGHTDDWSPRQLGIAAHAETVRIHPFTDGNGRTTRLLADLVFVAAQLVSHRPQTALERYDWLLDKEQYVVLLREYDNDRDPNELADFIATRPLLD